MKARKLMARLALLVREDRPSIVHRMSLIQVPVENKIYRILAE